MARLMENFFSPVVASLVGLLVVGLLVVAISKEESVQPLRNHYWANQLISTPLSEGVRYSQILAIPDGLAQQNILLALYFGCSDEPCSGSFEVSLKQGDRIQLRRSPELSPSPSLRYRFPFSGYSAGPAVFEIKGLSGNGAGSPGILYTVEPGEHFLVGPDLPQHAYLSFDWFKVMAGGQKFASAFPNKFVLLLWLLPFAGFVTLAWLGMRPEKNTGVLSSD